MNYKIVVKNLKLLALALVALAMVASPSFAAEYNLRAGETTVTIAGTPITVWGFECLATSPSGCPGTPGVITVPGPELRVAPGDTTLTINLTNDLLVPVSIVVPGQVADNWAPEGVARKTSFQETAAASDGVTPGTAIYTWSNLKPGTYLYHSGSNPAVQVQMGLYGAVIHDAAAGEAYAGKLYDNEVVLFYSEIDPDLGPPKATIDYTPTYFLINGAPYPTGNPVSAGDINSTTLIRFLNAGLMVHVPALQGSYFKVIAEDGNVYPYEREQYSVLLAPGKTLDALWNPTTEGTYPIYDRSLHLTTAGAFDGGMRADLVVGTVAGFRVLLLEGRSHWMGLDPPTAAHPE
jgi:FtsP/CotA-like multicopper oxidase with cupredoxin domain